MRAANLPLLIACALLTHALSPGGVVAQQTALPSNVLPLGDLEAFAPVANNWSIAGSVRSNRHEDHSLRADAGQGVLVNLPSQDARDNLFTDWQHGDIELELEFLVPKGSNSGIYLQGRYEIQILDSWRVQNPKFSDCGGIYQRWDDDRPESQRGYEGQPPRVNVSRAPGLWQDYRILFRAPRFDAEGRKTENARFLRVEHNGVIVHENVEVTGPTRAAAFTDEQALGPLMIQGDHGPVAFRNIRYKRFETEPIVVSDLSYAVFDGAFERLPDFSASTPSARGMLDELTWDFGANRDTFAVRIDGNIKVPADGVYRFDLGFDWVTDDPHFQSMTTAGGELYIDGTRSLVHRGKTRQEHGDVALKAGEHALSLRYFKNRFWSRPTFSLHVEGPVSPWQPLSVVSPSSPVGAILVTPANEPVLLRSFMWHTGDKDSKGGKRTHAISVGEPEDVHYSYDLATGALLQVWRGGFVDATPMWHSRGQTQLGTPRGSVISMSGEMAITAFTNDARWPAANEGFARLRYLGYAVDEAGRPTFRYALDDISVEDHLEPVDGSLMRTITLRSERPRTDVWIRTATGIEIEHLDGSAYAVNDRTFYVDLPAATADSAVIQSGGGRQELLVPVRFVEGMASVSYSLIW